MCDKHQAKLCGNAECDVCWYRSVAAILSQNIVWSDINKVKSICALAIDKRRYWFTCQKCGHDSYPTLHRVRQGNWCLYCHSGKLCNNDCQHCHDRSFAANPKAKYWSKLNTDSPRDLCALASRAWRLFDCGECGQEFRIQLTSIKRGQWCPKCAFIRQWGADAISVSTCPFIWSLWACDLNDADPRFISIKSKKMCLFRCRCNNVCTNTPLNIYRDGWRCRCGWRISLSHDYKSMATQPADPPPPEPIVPLPKSSFDADCEWFAAELGLDLQNL
jgi:hypothetical protein